MTLYDVCDELSDGLHKAPIFSNEGEYLFVNALNLSDGYIIDTGNGKRSTVEEWKKYGIELNERTILYSIDGTIGNMARYRGEKCILGKGACYIKLGNAVDVDYMYYLLQSNHFKDYLRSMQTGSTIHHISLATMREYPLPEMPSLEEQKIIGSLLARIDAKIASNKKLMIELESTARLIYDYWFTQFDFPDENGQPYRSSGGKMVWNDELKQEIPDGWYCFKLIDCLDYNLRSIKSVPSAMAYLDTSSLTQNRLVGYQILDEPSSYPSRAKRLVKDNDILISTVRPEQRHYGLLKHVRHDLVVSTGFVVLSPKQGEVFSSLFYLFITQESILAVLDTIANSSVSSYPSIDPQDVLNLKIALPNRLSTLKAEAQLLDGLFERHWSLQNENDQLASLRNWLLPMLMNGQATVGE